MIRFMTRMGNRLAIRCRLGLLILLSAMAADGCIIIPTPPHGGYGVITSESIQFLEPGKTARSEVLLRFGNPNQLGDNRFFAYRWRRTVALVGIYGGGGDEIQSDHYLALEFGSDHRLKRFKLIEPWLFQNPETQLKEWIVQKDDPSEGKGGASTLLDR